MGIDIRSKSLEELKDIDFPDNQFIKDFPMIRYSSLKNCFEPVSKEEYEARRKRVLSTELP